MEFLVDTVEYFQKYPSVLITLVFILLYFVYYLTNVVKHPHVACRDEKLSEFLYTHCPILKEKFWPTFWCFESRAQTILRSVIKSSPRIKYDSEILQLSDGGQVCLDWVENDNDIYPDKETRPTVILLPGLTGTSQESYALHYVQEATKLGCRVVVFNNRGNGSRLLTARTYCATNTEDLSVVVAHVNSRYPNSPKIGTGISLGGMVLMRYVALEGRKCGLVAAMCVSVVWDLVRSLPTLEAPGLNKHVINKAITDSILRNFKEMILFSYLAKIGRDSGLMAGMCVSIAWNVFESFVSLERPGINRHLLNRFLARSLVDSVKQMILLQYVASEGRKSGLRAAMCISIAWDVFESVTSLEAPGLNKHFINRLCTFGLVRSIRQNLHLFEDTVEDIEHVLKSKTIREFDDRFTAPMFGYECWEDYYRDACVHDKVHALEIPVLCLNAADDPFSPKHAIPLTEAEKNDNIAIVMTSHGGHIGFLEGLFPRHTGYMDRLFSQFADAVFKHGHKHLKQD